MGKNKKKELIPDEIEKNETQIDETENEEFEIDEDLEEKMRQRWENIKDRIKNPLIITDFSEQERIDISNGAEFYVVKKMFHAATHVKVRLKDGQEVPYSPDIEDDIVAFIPREYSCMSFREYLEEIQSLSEALGHYLTTDVEIISAEIKVFYKYTYANGTEKRKLQTVKKNGKIYIKGSIKYRLGELLQDSYPPM